MDPNPFRRRTFTWPWRTRSEVRAEVDEELRFHLDMRAEELAAGGMSCDQARREAAWRFGDLEYTRRYCVEQGSRKEERARRQIMFDELRQDVTIGCRRLWKTRGVAGVALLTLALGIGANTAVFSLVNAALLRPLPYREAGRLVLYYEGFPKAGMPKMSVSPSDFLDFQRDQRTCEALSIFQNNEAELGGEGTAERVVATRVSPNLFRTLGVTAAMGRTFADKEDATGTDVAVLSHALWQRRFGARPDIVGQRVTLDRRRLVVVGVMPRDFYFPPGALHGNDQRGDLWIPFVYTDMERQARGMLYRNGAIGRLKPGVRLEQAGAEAPVLAQRTWTAYPAEFRNLGYSLDARVEPLREEVVGDIRLPLLVLLASVALVLLVACANVANLLLSRAAARRHELVVMSALGASRGRLRKMLVTESVILGLAGGAAGLFLAWLVTGIAPGTLPDRLAQLGDVSLDVRVLAFTFAISLLTALVFGLVPASGGSSANLQTVLGTAGRTTTGGRRHRLVQRGLVVVTVTLAVVLLVGAGLLTRSFGALVATDVGIRPDHVLTATVSLPRRAYQRGEDIRAFFHRSVEQLQALPGVRIAAASTDLPLAGREHLAFTPEASPIDLARLPQSVSVTWPIGDYFRAHGIPLRRGRLFTPQDREGTEPVVVVSDSFAKRVWPGMDPVGRRMKWGIAQSDSPWMRVVGVVGDVKDGPVQAETDIHVYEPYDQRSPVQLAEWGVFRTMSFSLKTAAEPATFVQPVRDGIARLDPALAISSVETMESRLAAAVGPQRLSTILMSAFALSALLMAAIGIYGILAYAIAQRRREIGVRVALGAGQREVVGLIARQGIGVTAIGLVIGIACALALTRFMSGLLYRTTPYDAWTLASVAVLLGAVALLACYLPARRAARIDPIEALRVE